MTMVRVGTVCGPKAPNGGPGPLKMDVNESFEEIEDSHSMKFFSLPLSATINF